MSESSQDRQSEEVKWDNLNMANMIARAMFHYSDLITAMSATLLKRSVDVKDKKEKEKAHNTRLIIVTCAGQAEKALDEKHPIDERDEETERAIGKCLDEAYNIYVKAFKGKEPPKEIRDLVIEPMAKLRAHAHIALAASSNTSIDFLDEIEAMAAAKSDSSKKNLPSKRRLLMIWVVSRETNLPYSTNRYS